MKKKYRLLVLILFICFGTSFAKYVAVLETVSSQQELLTLAERQYLTNVLREHAVKELPTEMNYTIMTRENINVMLPPGKSIEECEGSCLAETGRNIAADYVAQARVSRVGETISISAEIYETAGGKLIASFNGLGVNVEQVIDVIKEKAPAFFRAARGNLIGVNRLGSTSEFSIQAKTSYIVSIVTSPEGAAISIDGRPVQQCPSTPCQITLEEGDHRIIAVKELFDDAESVEKITANDQQITMNLEPNFGTLEINPVLELDVGKREDLLVSVDGKNITTNKINLVPGVHSVRLSHPCYDPSEFSVGIEKGGFLSFDSSLVRGKAGLKLNVEENGSLKAAAVYVNGNFVGNTPFFGEVPMCSEITVDNAGKQEKVIVNLKWHETVEYVHKLEVSQIKFAEQDLEKDVEKQKTQGSVASNITQEKHPIHWIPISVSAVIAVAGGTLAILGNAKAKSISKEKASSIKEYESKKDDVNYWQTLRLVGMITAAAGVAGIGVSFAF